MKVWVWTDGWFLCCGSPIRSSLILSVPSSTMSLWRTVWSASLAMALCSTLSGKHWIWIYNFLSKAEQLLQADAYASGVPSYRNGSINIPPFLHSITATIACNMDLTKYPMDRQECTLQLESCKHFYSHTHQMQMNSTYVILLIIQEQAIQTLKPICVCMHVQGAIIYRMWCFTGPEGMTQWRG